MSARGRNRKTDPTLFPVAAGEARVGGKDVEFHPTDPIAVECLLASPLLSLPGGVWIEPCAGSGSIVRTVNRHRDVMWLLNEISVDTFSSVLSPVKRDCDELAWGDFCTMRWPYPMADVLVMNPPFSQAQRFAEVAFNRAHHVVMLHRSGWFGTPRASWLRKFCPDAYSLPMRPSFSGDGKTDMSEYTWFHWPPGNRERRWGRVAMLDMPDGGQGHLFGGAA